IETLASQRIDIAEGGAELVVEEGPLHAGRQRMADVADLLANLVPEIGNLPGTQRVEGNEGNVGLTRTREGHDALVRPGFHQLFLDAFGDLAGQDRKSTRL